MGQSSMPREPLWSSGQGLEVGARGSRGVVGLLTCPGAQRPFCTGRDSLPALPPGGELLSPSHGHSLSRKAHFHLEALEAHRPQFISRSQERLRKLERMVQQRKAQQTEHPEQKPSRLPVRANKKQFTVPHPLSGEPQIAKHVSGPEVDSSLSTSTFVILKPLPCCKLRQGMARSWGTRTVYPQLHKEQLGSGTDFSSAARTESQPQVGVSCLAVLCLLWAGWVVVSMLNGH
ncbi:Hypothetical predicted protein [Marmota monax]|uniref:ALMS motif domain-containing protein n=1 Tax=Marmota monax TaxID=9995 RepID=A0A5E4CE61_MARMO|nr:Hypothetical predicted protein [Marmota monax]